MQVKHIQRNHTRNEHLESKCPPKRPEEGRLGRVDLLMPVLQELFVQILSPTMILIRRVKDKLRTDLSWLTPKHHRCPKASCTQA